MSYLSTVCRRTSCASAGMLLGPPQLAWPGLLAERRLGWRARCGGRHGPRPRSSSSTCRASSCPGRRTWARTCATWSSTCGWHECRQSKLLKVIKPLKIVFNLTFQNRLNILFTYYVNYITTNQWKLLKEFTVGTFLGNMGNPKRRKKTLLEIPKSQSYFLDLIMRKTNSPELQVHFEDLQSFEK